jgi:hypothetical protein
MKEQSLQQRMLGNIPDEELKSITGQYPYFGPLHFFRLQGMNPQAGEYDQTAGIAALHFRDPLRLQVTLATDGKTSVAIPEAETRIPQPVSDSSTELIFEPLHASDYFASQGIKLSAEPAADDKLGKQLKSFTEWLKTMKRLPAAEIAARIPLDKEVEKMAEKSDRQVEVVTESMAEVLVDQGKYDKAIAIYEKLSLQNPSKLSYFAGKINELKSR